MRTARQKLALYVQWQEALKNQGFRDGYNGLPVSAFTRLSSTGPGALALYEGSWRDGCVASGRMKVEDADMARRKDAEGKLTVIANKIEKDVKAGKTLATKKVAAAPQPKAPDPAPAPATPCQFCGAVRNVARCMKVRHVWDPATSHFKGLPPEAVMACPKCAKREQAF